MVWRSSRNCCERTLCDGVSVAEETTPSLEDTTSTHGGEETVPQRGAAEDEHHGLQGFRFRA